MLTNPRPPRRGLGPVFPIEPGAAGHSDRRHHGRSAYGPSSLLSWGSLLRRLICPLSQELHLLKSQSRAALWRTGPLRRTPTVATDPGILSRWLDRALMGSGWRWPRASHSNCWPGSLSDCWPDGTGFLPSSAAAG